MKITPKKIKDPIITKADAISAAGSASKLSRILGVGRAAVCAWGDIVPPLQSHRIARAFPHLDKNK